MPTSDPATLPLFPLGAVLFPRMDLPLHIFEDRYKQLIHDRGGEDPAFGVVLIRAGGEVGGQPRTYDLGTAARIVAQRNHDDGRFDLVVRGGRRFRILERDWSGAYLVGAVEWLDDIDNRDTGPAMVDTVWQAFLALANAYLEQVRRVDAASAVIDAPDRPTDVDPCSLGFLLASRLPISSAERQRLLGMPTGGALLRELTRVLAQERRLVATLGATVVVAARPESEPAPG